MDLSVISQALSNGLTKLGWQTVAEDDYPDFKQLVCQNPAGPLRIFTRLDVLVMTPELNPADASGICLCFLYYADPTNVVDMFNLGRTIRQNESHLLRSHTESIFKASKLMVGNPSIRVQARPKGLLVRFSEDNTYQPAFMVELGYWLSCEKFPFEKVCTSEVVHFTGVLDERIIDERVEAIYALRSSDLRETEVFLLNAASDTTPQIRIAALAVLSEYCDNNYLSLFENALNDDDEMLRRFAGEYLKTYRKHIRSSPVITSKMSVSECLKNLTSSNDFTRKKAVEDLKGVTDPKIIQPLLAIMKGENDDYWCRLAALDALDMFDCPELWKEFYSILSDEQIGSNAAYLLSYKSDPIAQELLHKAFFSENRVARLNAARCVRCNHETVLQEYCHMLSDTDSEYRIVAVTSLYYHYFFRFRREKRECLDLLATEDRADSSLYDMWPGEELRCTENFAISEESNKLVITALMAAAKDENKEVRGKAIESLCLIDKAQGVPVLLDALKGFINIALDDNYQSSGDPWCYDWYQSSLLHAIDALGDMSFCEPLTRLLESKCWDIKLSAASSLLGFGNNSAVGVLKEALNHESWSIRSNAACILFAHGDKRMWDVLVKMLSENVDDDLFKKHEIIDTLAKSGDPRTVDAFCNILNHSNTYSVDDMELGRIITHLGEIGDPRAIDTIRKWQFKELVNCDDDVVEKTLKLLTPLLPTV